jgi:hypothetical protein
VSKQDWAEHDRDFDSSATWNRTVDDGTSRLVARILGILIFVALIPLSAFSFYRYRLPKKEQEYERIIESLGEKRGDSKGLLQGQYGLSDYLLPVSLATVIALLGAFVAIVGEDIQFKKDVVPLLFSPLPNCSASDSQKCLRDGLVIISMGFFGAYLWTVQYVFRRFMTIDLPPAAYYNVSTRIVVPPILALVVAYIISGTVQLNMVAAMAFCIGLFPEWATRYLKDKLSSFLGGKEDTADQLPLEMIEGITVFQRVRFAEVGIDNAQNLAEADFAELLVRTPFRPEILIDWIAQAKLYVLFKSDIQKLRRCSIRTVLHFERVVSSQEGLSGVAQSAGISEGQLHVAYEIVNADPSIARLKKTHELFASGRLPGITLEQSTHT